MSRIFSRPISNRRIKLHKVIIFFTSEFEDNMSASAIFDITKSKKYVCDRSKKTSNLWISGCTGRVENVKGILWFDWHTVDKLGSWHELMIVEVTSAYQWCVNELQMSFVIALHHTNIQCNDVIELSIKPRRHVGGILRSDLNCDNLRILTQTLPISTVFDW